MEKSQLEKMKATYGRLPIFKPLLQAATDIINQREKSMQTELALISLSVIIKRLIIQQESRP